MCPFLNFVLPVFSLAVTSSLAFQGALQDGFCYGVVSSDVAKPGELASFSIDICMYI